MISSVYLRIIFHIKTINILFKNMLKKINSSAYFKVKNKNYLEAIPCENTYLNRNYSLNKKIYKKKSLFNQCKLKMTMNIMKILNDTYACLMIFRLNIY